MGRGVMADSSLAAALADIDRFTEQHMPPWSVIVAAARERLRLHRDEDGEWPAELRAFVASELSYPRVATDAHERKAIAMLDAVEKWMEAK